MRQKSRAPSRSRTVADVVVAADAHAARRHDQVGRCTRAAPSVRSIASGSSPTPLQDHVARHRPRSRPPPATARSRRGSARGEAARRARRARRRSTGSRPPDGGAPRPRRCPGTPARPAWPVTAARPAGPRRRPGCRAPAERTNAPGCDRRRHGHDAVGLRDVLDRHHGVRAGGQRRAGHDPDRRPALDRSGASAPGGDLAGDAQGTGRIGGAQREAVHRRVGERRDVDRGDDPWIGEDPPGGIGQRNRSSPVRRACASRRAWASSSDSIGPVSRSASCAR